MKQVQKKEEALLQRDQMSFWGRFFLIWIFYKYFCHPGKKMRTFQKKQKREKRF